jgi:hypothetical protein
MKEKAARVGERIREVRISVINSDDFRLLKPINIVGGRCTYRDRYHLHIPAPRRARSQVYTTLKRRNGIPAVYSNGGDAQGIFRTCDVP